MSIDFQILGSAGRDNALLVRIDSGQVVTRLLFDCGDGCLSDLKISEVRAVDHLFFSHLHMDHIGGFDSFFRYTFNRDFKANILWGPPATAEIMHHRFRGFMWKLNAATNYKTKMKTIPYADLDTVFLDVGNTLISMDLSWVAEELAAVGLHCQVQALQRAEAAARPLVSKGLERRSTEGLDAFSFYLGSVLGCLPDSVDIDPLLIKEISRKLAPILRPPGKAERLWSSVIPGVNAALEALKRSGLKLVAVSNSDGTVEDVLIRQRLRPYFTAVYDSHQVGFEKPDPRIFHYVIKDLKADPARTLHVGDLYNIDIAGARAAGLHAVLIDPFGDWKDVDCECVRDLGELSRKVIAARNR